MVIDWNYLNGVQTEKLPSWRVVVPSNAAVASYYYQAINAAAPHPAAARLWQEFLYSDEGQNLFAQGGVRPVRADHDDLGRHAEQGRVRQAAGDRRPDGDPDRGAEQGRQCLPGRELGQGDRLSGGAGPSREIAPRLREALPLVPFLALVGVFLVIPTVTVLVNAFVVDGSFAGSGSLTVRPHRPDRDGRSLVLSGVTAVIGAVLSAVLAWLVLGRPATSLLRRAVLALCSVLAQFGGVALAFAFLATIGSTAC